MTEICFEILQKKCVVDLWKKTGKMLISIDVSVQFSSVQFSSVAQSCPTLCDPMNRSMPGLLVHHQLPEFTQTHVHRASDAISSSVIPFSSCPQSLPASESFPVSQLFTWGGQSTGASALASFLLKKSQGWSPSEWTGWVLIKVINNFFFSVYRIKTKNFRIYGEHVRSCHHKILLTLGMYDRHSAN